MTIWDPIMTLERCDEINEFVESRTYSCDIINFIYEKFPKVFDEYLALPLVALFQALRFGIVLD